MVKKENKRIYNAEYNANNYAARKKSGKVKKANAKYYTARKKSGKYYAKYYAQVLRAKEAYAKAYAKRATKHKAELEEKVVVIRERKREDPSTDVYEDKLSRCLVKDTHRLGFEADLTLEQSEVIGPVALKVMHDFANKHQNANCCTSSTQRVESLVSGPPMMQRESCYS